MTLEPRQADPRALARWSLQAMQLILRGAGSWIGLMLLLCLAIFAGQHLPLVAGVLSLGAFFASVIVAARLDRARPAHLGDVLEALRAHGRQILVFAAVIACAGALVWALLLAPPGVSWWNLFWTDRNTVSVLSPDWLMAMRQIFVYAAYALGLCYFGLNIPGLTSFFQFPCVALLGLSYREAYRQSAAAQMRNILPMIGVALAFIVLPGLAILAAPYLVPLLYCYLGALAWVAFREIFLGIRDNAVVARAAATDAAPAGA
jgi:hypothetical protein